MSTFERVLYGAVSVVLLVIAIACVSTAQDLLEGQFWAYLVGSIFMGFALMMLVITIMSPSKD